MSSRCVTSNVRWRARSARRAASASALTMRSKMATAVGSVSPATVRRTVLPGIRYDSHSGVWLGSCRGGSDVGSVLAVGSVIVGDSLALGDGARDGEEVLVGQLAALVRLNEGALVVGDLD